MSFVDMDEAELLRYAGQNEKPDDFDAFWEEGIREMEALGTEAEFRKADFQVQNAECFDLYFQGVGGSTIHGVYVRPAHIKEQLPAVLEFHGYSASCCGFRGHLCWTTAGFCIAGMDCRGQGGFSDDLTPVHGTTLRGHIIRGLRDGDPRKMYFRNVFLDTAQFARIIAALPEVDQTRIGAEGGSQGGGLASVCAALTPWISRLAIQYPFLSDYHRAWSMHMNSGPYMEINDYFRTYDPRHLREKEIFTKLGYIDIQHFASRIQAKVRMYTGLMDTVAPPSTQFATYNKIVAPKDYQLYPDFGHEYLPGQQEDVMQFMQEMVK